MFQSAHTGACWETETFISRNKRGKKGWTCTDQTLVSHFTHRFYFLTSFNTVLFPPRCRNDDVLNPIRGNVRVIFFFQDFKAAFKNSRDSLFCSFSCPEDKTTRTGRGSREEECFCTCGASASMSLTGYFYSEDGLIFYLWCMRDILFAFQLLIICSLFLHFIPCFLILWFCTFWGTILNWISDNPAAVNVEGELEFVSCRLFLRCRRTEEVNLQETNSTDLLSTLFQMWNFESQSSERKSLNVYLRYLRWIKPYQCWTGITWGPLVICNTCGGRLWS